MAGRRGSDAKALHAEGPPTCACRPGCPAPPASHQAGCPEASSGRSWGRNIGTSLLESRVAARLRHAQVALTHSLKRASCVLETKVSEVSRRGWNEASKILNTGGPGTLALTGGSGGPHERSSLLLSPGDGYQRLDNSRASDGWGDDNWSNDWGSGNNSLTTSPTQGGRTSVGHSPNARGSKMNSNGGTSGKMKSSKSKEGTQEQQLLVDLGNDSNNSKGHTWDNWDEDWEKIDGQ